MLRINEGYTRFSVLQVTYIYDVNGLTFASFLNPYFYRLKVVYCNSDSYFNLTAYHRFTKQYYVFPYTVYN